MPQHAFIELVDHMGGDLAVVNGARVSYGKSSTEMTEKDERLLVRLMRDRHGSPFEQAVMTFYVRCPIFVMREWIRHRMGSFNEISGRYRELDTDFFVPKTFRKPAPEEVQMNYRYVPVSDEENEIARGVAQEALDQCEAAYRTLLDMGIAKEHARIVLPVAIYTEFRWTVNSRALMNFLSLRTAPGAMAEIRSYALAIENTWKTVMPVTAQAFVDNGRVSP